MKIENIKPGQKVANTTYSGTRYGAIIPEVTYDETGEKILVMMYRDSKFRTPLRKVWFILYDTEPIDSIINPERVRKMIEKIGGIEPEAVPEHILQSLQRARNAVRIRFSWPPSADSVVKERFSQLGIPLPENARPMNSGINGGTPMYSLSSEIHYPKGLGLGADYGIEDAKGEMYVSRVSLALALAQKGFDIDVATL